LYYLVLFLSIFFSIKKEKYCSKSSHKFIALKWKASIDIFFRGRLRFLLLKLFTKLWVPLMNIEQCRTAKLKFSNSCLCFSSSWSPAPHTGLFFKVNFDFDVELNNLICDVNGLVMVRLTLTWYFEVLPNSCTAGGW